MEMWRYDEKELPIDVIVRDVIATGSNWRGMKAIALDRSTSLE
jgi:phosphoribosylaminoimidazole-succinocarboxamide synthase